MVDICKMSNFPTLRYAEQHELPEWGPPDYTYQHTRILRIFAQAELEPNGDVKKFSASMSDYLVGYGNYPGKPRPANWQDEVEKALGEVHLIDPRNPFDFNLWFRSRIAIILVGNFWRFSPKLAPITMKHTYGDQYFDLRRHEIIGGAFINVTERDWERSYSNVPSRCISFFTKNPCQDSDFGGEKVLHGFSLNMELVDDSGKVVLPMTFDPDVENKGGNPGP